MAASTRLFLVRHGETDWNLGRRYQGQSDVPLNDRGLRQAEATARHLAEKEISLIVSSDLRRARQTAEAIALRCKLPVQEDQRLREMSFGAWEGMTHDEIQARWPGEREAWFADPVRIAPPGGETLAQVSDRVRSALDEIVKRSAGGTAVLVAHGGVLRTLICLAVGLDPQVQWRFRIHEASISEVQVYDGTGALVTLNHTHHLETDRS
jgi:alpha-ribazole phosphatase